MSVIVLGMEMPTSCASCRMAVCFLDTGKAKCYATLSYIDPKRGKRSYDCPLRPLPEKHGRLIDADAFIGTIRPIVEEDDYAGCTFRTVKELMTEHIDEAPTIVESEGD